MCEIQKINIIERMDAGELISLTDIMLREMCASVSVGRRVKGEGI